MKRDYEVAEAAKDWLDQLGMPVALAILHNEEDVLLEETGAATLDEVDSDEARRLSAALDLLDPTRRLVASSLPGGQGGPVRGELVNLLVETRHGELN